MPNVITSSFIKTFMESATVAAMRNALGLGTGDSPQVTALNVGHASDTTITRVSAGVIAVEGATVPALNRAQTFTHQNAFTLMPNCASFPMASVTASGVSIPNKNKKYHDTISADREYVIPTMISGDGFQVLADVTAACVLTFSFATVKRIGLENATITTLALNKGLHILRFSKEDDGSVTLVDSVNNSRLYFEKSFDPQAVCDGAVSRLFLKTILDDLPNGFVITRARVTFEANPTTEFPADFKLKRADAFIGVAGAADVLVMGTTAGFFEETDPAEINGGVAIANGKILYLEWETPYTEAGHQCSFEMWGYAVN